MLGDLPVAHAHNVNGLELNLSAPWSHTEELSQMSPVVGLVGRDPVAIGQLPMDLRMKVGECGTNISVEFSDSCFVWSSVRLRRVIREIIGEEFVEDVKSSLSLDLFSIPAYNGFCF